MNPVEIIGYEGPNILLAITSLALLDHKKYLGSFILFYCFQYYIIGILKNMIKEPRPKGYSDKKNEDGGNYEGIERTEPGTTWISTGSPLSGSQVSRPTFQQLTDLSTFMKEKFNYETGPFEGYSNTNTSNKFLVRVDWNINDKNKLTARYVHHNSEAQINISNSQSAGFGNRTQNINAMSFQNSGYTIQDNTRSAVLELNSKFSNT
jgi:hypothetical protein